MFAVVIAFLCFYHAERILSSIAKFLVHLFWVRGGADWNGRGESKEESGGRNEKERKMGMREKIAPKRNRFGIWGRLRRHRPVSYIFRKLFAGTGTFSSHILSYYVSILNHLKLTQLQSWQYLNSRYINSTYLELLQIPRAWGGASAPWRTSLERCTNVIDDRWTDDRRRTDGSCHKANVT